MFSFGKRKSPEPKLLNNMVVIGHPCKGKSTLIRELNRYTTFRHKSDYSYKATSKDSRKRYEFPLSIDGNLELYIYDTPGQKHIEGYHQSERDSTIKSAESVIIVLADCYQEDDKMEKEIRYWLLKVKKIFGNDDIPIMIVYNKMDKLHPKVRDSILERMRRMNLYSIYSNCEYGLLSIWEDEYYGKINKYTSRANRVSKKGPLLVIENLLNRINKDYSEYIEIKSTA